MVQAPFKPKVFGKYLLLEKIGIGGTAEVYKAKTYGSHGFEKYVALKVVLPQFSSDTEFVTMLVDEAKLTVLLNHQNIVEVYDLNQEEGNYFFAMEYVEGCDLKHMANKFKELKQNIGVDVLVYIMSEVCKGLDYAHSKKDKKGNPLNIIHRDISPQNILISYGGEVKVMDFGIAKAEMTASMTEVGTIKGKVTYMSPEQALGQSLDHRSDLFATGLVFYELFAGKKFFSGETVAEIITKVRKTHISLKDMPEDMPLEIKKILVKTLSNNREERYQNAGDIQADLTRYLYTKFPDFNHKTFVSLLQNVFKDEIFEIEQKKLSEPVPTTSEEVQMNMSGSINITGLELSGIHPSPPQEKKSNLWLFMLPLVFLFVVIFFAVAGFGIYKYIEAQKPEPGKRDIPIVSLPDDPPSNNNKPQVTQGDLVINSDPPGAQIWLNGVDTHLLTPAELKNLAFGTSHRITLKKEYYQNYDQISILSEEKTALNVLLKQPEKGSNSLSELGTSDDPSQQVVEPQKKKVYKKKKKRNSSSGGGGDWSGGQVW